MKKHVLFLLFILTLSCCEKDDDSNNNTLPPATQTGANNAGCLVNGEAFLPGFGQTPLPLSCNYTGDMDFSLNISNEVNDVAYTIYIYIGNTDLQVGQTYQLGENVNDDSKYGIYYLQNPLPDLYEIYYSTNEIIRGELTITHHDFDNAFLSGTFWFDAKYSHNYNYNAEIDETKIIQVREGRFDAEY